MKQLKLYAAIVLVVVTTFSVLTCRIYRGKAFEAEDALVAVQLEREGWKLAAEAKPKEITRTIEKLVPALAPKIKKAKEAGAKPVLAVVTDTEPLRFHPPCHSVVTETPEGTTVEEPWVDVTNKVSVVAVATPGGDVAVDGQVETTLFYEGGTYETLTSPFKQPVVQIDPEIKKGLLCLRKEKARRWRRAGIIAAAVVGGYIYAKGTD